MTVDKLLVFLRETMRMQHIYQPVLIKTLLDNGGRCTRRQLALALLIQDESQIMYYEKRLKEMPLPVLKKHGVIAEAGGMISIQIDKIDKLSLEEKAAIRLECDTLIHKFVADRGLGIWDHRMIDDDPVPDSLRYLVLKRDRKCLLCGATSEEAQLQADHIIPRTKGGKTTLENLQTLCFRCNGGKSNKDDMDFRWRV